ncbi:MAG: DDE-type integrase/transposase/recombinase [Desulfomonilaceae bacterium]
MEVVVEGKAQGITRKRTCGLLQIEERRVRNWFVRPSLADSKPGPEHAPHALLPEERTAIVVLAKDETFVDDSHRVLTAKCVDSGKLAVSASTVYRVMRTEGLTTDRSGRSHRNGNSRKPDRPELTGPNQRWCWDISYLRTLVPGMFLYLYALLDEYSRKVVAFRISWRLINEEGKELIEEAIEKEGLTPEQIAILVLFNDRGTQMKAKPFKKFLEDLGISQKFARPRTPNDNPFVESLFATTKGALDYPNTFTDDVEAIIYFTAYFDFYNNVRLHGEIGYVTPAQRHCGQDKAVRALRSVRLAEARRMRLQKNRCSSCDTVVAGKISDNQPVMCLTGYPGLSLIKTESGI